MRSAVPASEDLYGRNREKIMRCLVTGAAGFVGAPLVERLYREQICDVAVTTRSPTSAFPPDIRHFPIEITEKTDWMSSSISPPAFTS
jgi:nucleoside-diphosphate-sugar epimerase